MSADSYLEHMRVTKGMLPSTDTLALIVTELLTLNATNTVTYNQTSGSANCAPLYKNGAQWGALVNFKAGSIPSFVHELTHAACNAAYKEDLVNYKSKNGNNIAYVFTQAAIPKAPADTRACLNEVQRRTAWVDQDAKTFLENNLNNLEAWADVTDFTVPNPWMTKQQQKQMEALQKLIAKGKGTQADLDKFSNLQAENGNYGLLVVPKKKNEQFTAQQTEAARKKAYIKERISYGRNGMSGMGDVNFEYDTVINQMLYQMFMWGFRPSAKINPPLLMLAEQARTNTVPAQYFYGRLEMLASDAYTRRAAASQVANGAGPTITSPLAFINPPPVN